ncbi:MAG: NAD(P)-binding protein, partial [Clostridia bacterium]
MAINNTKRNKMNEQAPEVRAKNFKEVALGFDDDMALCEADRCLECKAAPCRKGCPVGVNIPAFINRIKNKDLDGAVEVLKGDNNLPAVCGRVCPQEEQCEKFCVRKEKLGGSVAIGSLERYVADYSIFRAPKQAPKSITPNGKKAAIVGSGPAGLTCAADLALAGFKVTVYEAFHKAGGVLVYGIPEFRLPKALVQAEIDKLSELGVDVQLNTIIGKTIMLDELIDDCDAVFIGTGAGLPSFLRINGENLN